MTGIAAMASIRPGQLIVYKKVCELNFGCSCRLGLSVKFAGAAGMDAELMSFKVINELTFDAGTVPEISSSSTCASSTITQPTVSLFQVMCSLL